MLVTKTVQSTSGNSVKSGDIYRFNLDNFWDGEWVHGGTKESDSEFIRLTRQEYLKFISEVPIPKSGCIVLNEISHAALYKMLLSRTYEHFGVTGIKTLYLIMCIEGYFGKKYKKITTHEVIRKLIGGRADCSHASDKFWKACYDRIKQENVSERISLKDYTLAEREIWRAFVRRASISCNRKKPIKSDN